MTFFVWDYSAGDRIQHPGVRQARSVVSVVITSPSRTVSRAGDLLSGTDGGDLQ